MSQCIVCEALIGSLQGLSSDKHVVQIFHHELVRGCEQLPKDYQEVCLNIVLQLAPQIEAISRTIPSSFICSHLKICNNYYERVEILNSHNCMKGPSFWCSSTYSAASCGTSAIEHCQRYVWMGPKPKKNPILLEKMLIAPTN